MGTCLPAISPALYPPVESEIPASESWRDVLGEAGRPQPKAPVKLNIPSKAELALAAKLRARKEATGSYKRPSRRTK
jgi:hypothetical protein